jgi:hypothetical protein
MTMGYEARTFTVTARVSRHNEERDNLDDAKWCQMAGRIARIVDEYLGNGFITDSSGTLPWPPTGPDHCVWCDEPATDHHPLYPPVTATDNEPAVLPEYDDTNPCAGLLADEILEHIGAPGSPENRREENAALAVQFGRDGGTWTGHSHVQGDVLILGSSNDKPAEL